MNTGSETIAAIATGAGRAGIGIVRVSGGRVVDIGKAVLGRDLPLREAIYLPFLDAMGQPIDIGVALRFVGPHSFTGEDVLELQGHGGAVVLDLLLARVLSLGARAARPGEFSERAFLNGKLDLAQAEAVADLVESGSVAAAQAAVRSLSGDFSRDVGAIVDELDALRAWLEAALDFSEEDIDFLADPALERRAVDLVERFETLLARAGQGQRLRDGMTVVIAGAPNVGKSTLLNALSGTDSAIVTAIAGTTRDLLHEHILIDDVPIHLIDTAGLRVTDDPVEREGVARAGRAAAAADHVLLLIDAGEPESMRYHELDPGASGSANVTPEARGDSPSVELPTNVPVTHVFTKIDAHSIDSGDTLAISAVTGLGMDRLRTYLLSLAGHDRAIEGVYLARRRHLDALVDARVAAESALARLRDGDMPELAAEELRLARQALERITGRYDTEDLLGRIFADFCVGK